jgi:DNA-binding NarL/FixJ family response regulator
LIEGGTSSPLAEAEELEMETWARHAVDRLPEHLRMSVLLVVLQGLKYREAAEVLGIPVGTLKSRLHAALKKLNADWKKSQEQPAATAATTRRGKGRAHRTADVKAGEAESISWDHVRGK